MRRKDREVTDFSKITEIISSCDCCRLGFVDGDEAYIVPMNFGYEIKDEQIYLYFHCAKEGRKIDLLPKQNKVSFEMDTKHRLEGGPLGCDYTCFYQSVMGTGKLEIVEGDEKTFGLKKIMEHYTGRTEWDFDNKYFNAVYILKLTVKALSCKEH